MDRRTVIADAAIEVIADAGLRALTHRKLDDALGFPAGSTSYYFRAKNDLIAAVIARITEQSRSEFGEVLGSDPAEVTVRYLNHLLSERNYHLRARHALLIDPAVDAASRGDLGRSVFSFDRATELFADYSVAAGFVALCEGLVVGALASGWTDESLRTPVVTYLKGAGKV